MGTKRLFIAIAFPETVRAYLDARKEELKRAASRGNFTREDNLHLTMVFIGETDRVDDIIKILEENDAAPFDLTLSRAGKFLHNRGDIYWIGIKESPALQSLVSRLENSLRASGFSIEQRPYRPHITLGRGVKAEYFDNKVSEITFSVDQYKLMESANEEGRLVYRQLCTRYLSEKKT